MMAIYILDFKWAYGCDFSYTYVCLFQQIASGLLILFCFSKKEPKKEPRNRIQPDFGFVPWSSFCTTVACTSAILLSDAV